jgi:RecJ-like exonuclease
MNVVIFTHGDADGICAGAIALDAHQDAHILFSSPYSILEDLSKVKDSDKVIICDISLPENNLTQILKRLFKIANRGDLTYIDHHPLPRTILKEKMPGIVIHNPTSSTSELTYNLFHSKVDPMHTRTAIYGAIADYLGHTPLIQELLQKWDERTLYFETGILMQGIGRLKNDHDEKRRILKNLAKNIPPSQDEALVRLALEYTRREWVAVSELKDLIRVEGRIAYVLNFPFSLGKTATYIRGMTGTLIGIAGEKRKDKIDMSLRTCDDRINLNGLLREILPQLGGSGGGHPMAAGARVSERNFNYLLTKLNESLDPIII